MVRIQAKKAETLKTMNPVMPKNGANNAGVSASIGRYSFVATGISAKANEAK